MACPSGALNPDSLKKSDANMGVVILKDFNKCMAFNNKILNTSDIDFLTSKKTHNYREEELISNISDSVNKICDLCIKLCPIGEVAIKMKVLKNGKNLPIIKNGCVGCGVCVEVCPVSIIESVNPHKNEKKVFT